MKKQLWFVLGLYVFMCIFSPVAFAAATPAGFAESVIALEKLVYGQERSGPYVDRVNALENMVYGKASTMPVPDKISRLNKSFYDNSEKASIPLILKYAESQLLHRSETGAVEPRVSKLEEALTGKKESGAIAIRLENVLKTVFASGTVTVSDTTASARTLVKIRLIDGLNSDVNKTGDSFRYEVVDETSVGTVLVIPAGSQGVGRVDKAKAAGRFGQHGKLDLSFNTVPAIDETTVSLYLGERAREENKHLVAAAGASVVGAALLGPIGLVGGAFVEGKTIKLPAGTEFFLEIQTDVTVRGASIERIENAPVPVTQVTPPQVAAVRIQ